jgi:hypothetical protein
VLPLKRWIGFHAYRCGLCRRRFFSVLPFRRIVASTSRSTEATGGEQSSPVSPVSGF